MAKGNGSETIIAHGVRVEGDFVSQGDIVIEGDVSGTIKTTGDLRVGEQAKIRADVVANNAVISGELRGNIEIVEQIEITATANIIGDLSAKTVSMASGAQLNGKVTMDGKAPKMPKESGEEK